MIAIYKLSIREFSLLSVDTKKGEDWKIRDSKASRFFPAKMIRCAGFVPSSIAPFYWILKISLTFLLPLIYMEVVKADASFLRIILGGVFGFLIIDLLLYVRARKRKQQIQKSVSYFVDLLVAFLKSGLNLSQAFERTAAYGLPKGAPLAKEVALVASEIELGLVWQEAFKKLALRTGSKELDRLALLMKIGQRTGAPMISSLNNYAELLREAQSERVNELLNRKALEALIPTLLLSMPVFLVLVFFPTGVQIFEAFQLFSSAW